MDKYNNQLGVLLEQYRDGMLHEVEYMVAIQNLTALGLSAIKNDAERILKMLEINLQESNMNLTEMKRQACDLIESEESLVLRTIGDVEGETRLDNLKYAFENVLDACSAGSIFAILYDLDIMVPQSFCDRWV